MPGAHSLLSPSGAVRWMNCPGSVRMTAHLPEETSEYAEEGTRLHELSAKVLDGEIDATTLFPTDYEAIREYLEWVDAQPGTYEVEQRVDLSHVLGLDEGGTADIILYDPATKTLTVGDLKTGYKPVNAYQNPQLMLYALGAFDRYQDVYDIEQVRLAIIQPRIKGTDLEDDDD